MYLSVWISEFKFILYILRLECPVYSYTMWRSTREEKWDPSLVAPKPLVLGVLCVRLCAGASGKHLQLAAADLGRECRAGGLTQMTDGASAA